MEDWIEKTQSYSGFSMELQINTIYQLNYEIRHRMKGVGVFLDKNSATILMFTRLYHVAGTCRGFHEVYDLKYLEALEQDQRER